MILLNSDVLVPVGWLPRFARCFESSADIALAMPLSTNANHVTIRPAAGQNWRDLDRALATISPTYPAPPGVVGCCLGVRMSLLRRRPMLDEAYDEGYWEDTDLHYFAKSIGLRSMIIDNLVVYHGSGSASFSATRDLPSIDDRNRTIFMQRWGAAYLADTRAFAAAAPLRRLRDERDQIARVATIDSIDVLFLLPLIQPSIGGVAVVLAMTRQLIENGTRAAVFCFGPIDWGYVNFLGILNPFVSVDQIQRSCAGVKTIVATAWESFE